MEPLSRLLIAIVAALTLLTTATTANASVPAADYCDKTLMGSSDITLAPDDDIKAEWNRIESYGYDVVAAYNVSWTQVTLDDVRMNMWIYERRNGLRRQEIFRCWRDLDSFGERTGTYHDAYYSNETGWYYP